MPNLTFKGKTYQIDDAGFLTNPEKWDEDFTEGLAPTVNIPGGLTEGHWKVIRFIRNYFKAEGKCPLVYKTCRENDLRLSGLKRLFPTGYLRGACKLAGLTFRDGSLEYSWARGALEPTALEVGENSYRIDVRGFLMDPSDWDESFAIHRAYDMKLPEGLTDRHWQVIRFLRESFQKNATVPTVYETSDALKLDLDELERLFPDGYHRGAVKIAGLRVI